MVEMRSRLQAQLGDAVRIVDVLGVHGAEYLLRAHDLERGADVLLRALAVDPESAFKAFRDFERGAESAARLYHPNIVPAGPFQPREGLVFYVVADIKASTVDLLLSEGVPLSPEHAFAILRDIASALDYAHGQGVVHGHLEPSSISVRGNDIASVFDFGAGAGAPSLHPGRSPAYMAPEQWQQDTTIDGRADVYALGVIAFELLTGRRRSMSQSMQGIAIVDSLPVTQDVPLCSGIGLHVNRAILRAVSKRAMARFATAGEFVAALEPQSQTVAQGLPTERPELLIERNPHFALVPMFLVVAFGIAVGVITVPSARQALHRFGGFSSIASAIDLRIPELPAFSDAPLARQGRAERLGGTASADGAGSSSQPIFPGAATAAGSQNIGGPTTTDETPESGSTRGGSVPLSGAGETSSTSDGTLQPAGPPESGFLRVEFDGPAALVMVDEIPQGRTPFVERVPSGVHTVRLVGTQSPFPIQQLRVFGGDTAVVSFSTR